jgi:hypothetical protein
MTTVTEGSMPAASQVRSSAPDQRCRGPERRAPLPLLESADSGRAGRRRASSTRTRDTEVRGRTAAAARRAAAVARRVAAVAGAGRGPVAPPPGPRLERAAMPRRRRAHAAACLDMRRMEGPHGRQLKIRGRAVHVNTTDCNKTLQQEPRLRHRTALRGPAEHRPRRAGPPRGAAQGPAATPPRRAPPRPFAPACPPSGGGRARVAMARQLGGGGGGPWAMGPGPRPQPGPARLLHPGASRVGPGRAGPVFTGRRRGTCGCARGGRP